MLDDGRLMCVNEDEDVSMGVASADAEVVEAACSAEGEFAESVDGVAADPVVGAERGF